ncbi:MAG TPA: Rne/Rng family ribonuclease [Melioribacteraceae bacterium]|nr:Rne/Rng family ribonuclease [Melioribacteraceae bacterium]
MEKLIIINSSASSTRVAITEDGNLVDFFVDNAEKERMVGDIYLGRVARVLPGIRAAFVDIGLKHDAFLHFSDIGERLEMLQGVLEENTDDDDDDEDDLKEDDNKDKKEQKSDYSPKLKKGEEILVQIIKEPVKDKGVRVTSSVSVPGRFCVLLPYDNKIGISKKIVDFKERRRLRKLARSIIPKNCGLIIRTAAFDQSEDVLESDLKYLVETWREIEESAKQEDPPTLLYKDLDTTNSVIRDLFTPDVNKVLIDTKKLYREIRSYLKLIQPELVNKVEFHKGNRPIFEEFKVEEQIKALMGRKVPLPSGGHIVIDHTEAMFVIDVNSGRYAAKKEQELNSLKTDLEAAREIVRQLRLRDIGGLIVVDFIDLEDDKNRKKIYDELKKEFKKDRAKVAMLPMTDFGLMQITRQRIRENIIQSFNEECPYCHGTGLLTRRSHLIHEIEEWVKKFKDKSSKHKIYLRVNPLLAEKLTEGLISPLRKLMLKNFIVIKLIVDIKVDVQRFHFLLDENGKDITEDFI